MKQIAASVVESLSDKAIVGTALIRAFGLTKIPMLAFVGPTVLEMSDTRSVVKIRLRRRTRNHLGVMYIGALVTGADCAGGLTAMRRIQKSGAKVDLLFKAMEVEFLRRVEGDAHFTCDDGPAITEAVDRTIATGERVNLPVRITTTVPERLGDQPVAQFVLTLTLKRR